MKIYRMIVIIFSIIIGVAFAVLTLAFAPGAKASYTASITTYDYQVLKDYAFEIASNSDVEPMDGITVKKTFTGDSLIVEVEASAFGFEFAYGVTTVFPVSYDKYEIEKEGIIKCEGIIDYNNVKYSLGTSILPPWYLILMTILSSAVLGVATYWMFYYIPNIIIKKVTKKHSDKREVF